MRSVATTTEDYARQADLGQVARMLEYRGGKKHGGAVAERGEDNEKPNVGRICNV